MTNRLFCPRLGLNDGIALLPAWVDTADVKEAVMSVNAKLSPVVLRVLHLDDDPFELERVQNALEKHPLACTFHVQSAATVEDFRKKLRLEPSTDIVILDIHVGEAQDNGISLAAEMRRLSPRSVILICSTADDVATIADCLNSGADDFISKQSDKGELSLRVYNSYRLARLKQGDSEPSNKSAMSQLGKPHPIGATMERVAQRVPLIIDSAITAVFIKGESGTGKEVVADLFGSALTSATPFVKVNCGAIAPSLLESELFGHIKGAFTGASLDKRGLFEAASGGWIFLDEVATLSPPAQVALLRVLENQEVLRVGSTKPVAISVRVLSATNETMEKLVRDGRFRADLWQRLRETEITLPPLRDRLGEIQAMIEHFCHGMPGGPYQVSGPAMEVLCNVSWREGNIRELRNCLRAMTEMHVDKLLTPLAIPERIWEELGEKPAQTTSATVATAKPTDAAASARPMPVLEGTILLNWDRSAAQSYDFMADLLLLEMTRQLAGPRGRLSLRGLAQTIGMSRSTLSGRLKALVHRQIIDLAELSRLVGISEK